MLKDDVAVCVVSRDIRGDSDVVTARDDDDSMLLAVVIDPVRELSSDARFSRGDFDNVVEVWSASLEVVVNEE